MGSFTVQILFDLEGAVRQVRERRDCCICSLLRRKKGDVLLRRPASPSFSRRGRACRGRPPAPVSRLRLRAARRATPGPEARGAPPPPPSRPGAVDGRESTGGGTTGVWGPGRCCFRPCSRAPRGPRWGPARAEGPRAPGPAAAPGRGREPGRRAPAGGGGGAARAPRSPPPLGRTLPTSVPSPPPAASWPAGLRPALFPRRRG